MAMTGPKVSTSPSRFAMPAVAAMLLVGIWTLASESTGESQQSADSDVFSTLQYSAEITRRGPPAHLRSRPSVETVRLRGNQSITYEALTTGPQWSQWAQLDSIDNVLFPHRMPSSETRYVVGWKPVVNEHKCKDGTTVQLVHHMNVRVSDEPDPGVSIGSLPHIIASYDRGAEEYHLPRGYGIPFQRGELNLEYHLLIPDCWDIYGNKNVFETSGIDLYVTSERPENLAGIIGLIDDHMDIKPGHGKVEQVTVAKPETLTDLFTKEALRKWAATSETLAFSPNRSASYFQLAPHLDVLAVHLHTHDISLSKSLEVVNPDGTVLFNSPSEPSGYGRGQSFISPSKKGWPQLRIQPGQSIRIHCPFDTDQLHHNVRNGVGHGDEMCSALILLGGPRSVFARADSVVSAFDGFVQRFGRALRSVFVDIANDIRRLTW